MLQIIVSVVSLQNGSMKAVSGTRHDEHVGLVDGLPAADAGAVEAEALLEDVLSSRASAGMVKCCHRPGKSMKRRSTAWTSFSRISARTSLGVTTWPPVRPASPATPPGCGKAGLRSAIYGSCGKMADSLRKSERLRLAERVGHRGSTYFALVSCSPRTAPRRPNGRTDSSHPSTALIVPLSLPGVVPGQPLPAQRLGQRPAVEPFQHVVAGPVLRAVQACPHHQELRHRLAVRGRLTWSARRRAWSAGPASRQRPAPGGRRATAARACPSGRRRGGRPRRPRRPGRRSPRPPPSAPASATPACRALPSGPRPHPPSAPGRRPGRPGTAPCHPWPGPLRLRLAQRQAQRHHRGRQRRPLPVPPPAAGRTPRRPVGELARRCPSGRPGTTRYRARPAPRAPRRPAPRRRRRRPPCCRPTALASFAASSARPCRNELAADQAQGVQPARGRRHVAQRLLQFLQGRSPLEALAPARLLVAAAEVDLGHQQVREQHIAPGPGGSSPADRGPWRSAAAPSRRRRAFRCG